MFAKAPKSGSGISTVVVFGRSSLRNTRRVKEPPSIFLEDQPGVGHSPCGPEDALSPSTPPGSACRWGPAKACDFLGFKRIKPGALRSADRLKDGTFLACVTGKTGQRASLQRERSLDRLDDVAERGLLRVARERSATAHPSVGLKDSCRGQAPKHLRKGCLRYSLRVGNPGNLEHRAARVAEQKAQTAKGVVGFFF